MADAGEGAVEAAARAICDTETDDGSRWFCRNHMTWAETSSHCEDGLADARAALAAALPLLTASPEDQAVLDAAEAWRVAEKTWTDYYGKRYLLQMATRARAAARRGGAAS